MFAILFVAVAVWAFSGALATVRAALASDEIGVGVPVAALGFAVGHYPAAGTFGQQRRNAYRRWRRNLRRGMPGTAGSRRPGHILADGAAAALAGLWLFTVGFASGVTWTTSRRGIRAATSEARKRRAPGSRPGAPATPPNAPRGPGSSPRREPGPGSQPGPDDPPRPSPPRTPPSSDEIVDAELLDDGPDTPVEPDDDYIDGEIVTPELDRPRNIPALEGTRMIEILNIHQLVDWANGASGAAIRLADEALIRRNAAMARAESAAAVANTAAGQAAQLEAVRARFASLNMDAASLASISMAIEAALTLAAAEQRRAEAEQMAAEAAEGAASAAELYQAAVSTMAQTVMARQGPHAVAQAETGNAAAHSSVLAVS